MPPMTTAAARVVDPVLTNVARGYRNEALIGTVLFPVVPVEQRGGKIVSFGAEDFAEYGLERAPGANRMQVHYGHSGADYALLQRALDGKVPIEILQDAAAVPGIDYAMVAVSKTMDIVLLQVEIAAAKLATTAGNYDTDNKAALSGSARWDHADSAPAKRVEEAKEQIAEGIGREPNVLVLGQPVYRALLNNKDVIDRIKHTEGLTGAAAPVVNANKLAQYFGVDQVVVGRARKGEPGSFKPIWGKYAVLAFSDVSSMASMGSPSFGYTYRLNGYPIAEPGYFDRTCDSWLYPVTSEDTPVIAGKAAGFLLSTVVD